jgi:broad specificity phosphatase PhoE
MTGKADFSEDEWTRLKRAPFVAGMAISLADPGWPIELVKETAAILEELAEVNRIVSENATSEEADAYRDWLKTAAQEAANAAKEGGFMGFHAERVSEGEQRMLDTLAEVLAPTV